MSTVTLAAIVGSLVGAAAMQGLAALGLWLYARFVARRRDTRWWRRVVWLPVLGFALSAVGVIVAGIYALRGAASLEGVDPSQKSTLLAIFISESMNCTALFALPSWLLYLGSLVTSIVGSLLKVEHNDRALSRS